MTANMVKCLSAHKNVLDIREAVFRTFFKTTAARCPPSLVNNVSQMKSAVGRLVAIAPKFDYGDIQANGYWTYAKILVKFVIMVNGSARRVPAGQLESIPDTLVELSSYLITQLAVIMKIHQSVTTESPVKADKSPSIGQFLVKKKESMDADSGVGQEVESESDDDDPIVDESQLFAFDGNAIVTQMLDTQSDPRTARRLGALYGHHNSFYLSECLQTLISRFCFMSTIYASPLSGIVSTLRSKDAQGAAYANYALNASLNVVKRLWSTTEGHLFKTVIPSLLYPLSPNIVKTVFVQRPSTGAWLIHPFTGELVKDRAGLVYDRENRIRCRLIQNGKLGESPNDSLIFHCHGAAFVAQSPDSHEIYLRDWAKKVDGVPILSVDYSLAPERKWPAAIQDVLDVYLWVTSDKNSVVEQLGFYPKNIVLAGDSAGAVLSLNLLHILADLKLEETSFSVLMPTALVAAYPVALVQLVMSPSRVLVNLDSLIPTGCLLSALDAYLFNIEDVIYKSPEMTYPELRQLEGHTKPGLLNYMWRSARSAMMGEREPEPKDPGSAIAWYRRSDKIVNRKLEEINRKGSHPYASPLHSANYDQLQDVRLYLAVGEYDVFLDDSVALATKWRGPVSFDVIPEICHGFLYFGLASDLCSEANKLVVNRLRLALKL